jgi:type II secretory pathway pseudopilin PulG
LRNEKGYTLAVVAVFTTVLLVTLSAAVLNWQKAMQREREEELIFRGKQFMRAIELWQRKFPGTYPTTIDALLSTSNTRFLRKKWKDPITNSDDWRLIKVNPDGSVSGLTIIPGSSPLGPSAFGSPTTGRGAASGTRAQAGAAAGTSSRTGISQGSRPVQTGLQAGQGQSAFNPVLGGIVGVSEGIQR